MNSIINILNSYFKIGNITISNFCNTEKEMHIEIEILSSEAGTKTLSFENVKQLNVSSEAYTCAEKPAVIIEDVSAAQLEGVSYRITISEDAMVFYCKEFGLK